MSSFDETSLQRDFADRVRSNLPPAWWSRGLDDLDANAIHAALDAARSWIAGDLQGLLLTGAVGTGKTSIAAAAARDRLRSERRIHWLTAYRYLADLSAPFESAERARAWRFIEPERQVIPRRPAALIVDDLDKVRATEYAAESMFGLVDACVQQRRPLIVTTNLKPSELGAKWPPPYGEAITSRLVGYCRVVALTGSDRRLKGAA